MSRGLAACLATVTLTAGCGGLAEPPVREETGVVQVVNDGDTIRLEDGRRIRLVQIDAPEESECYGRAATAALLLTLSRGTRIELESDAALDDRDEHGRLLRTVFVLGINVNLAQVRAGAAAPYFYRGARGRYADKLLDAAERARAHRLGLWAACPGTLLRPERGIDTGPA